MVSAWLAADIAIWRKVPCDWRRLAVRTAWVLCEDRGAESPEGRETPVSWGSTVRTVHGRTLDPELAALQVLMPELDYGNLAAARATEGGIARAMRTGSSTEHVQVEGESCPRPDGTAVPVRMYRPRRRTGRPLPVLLFIHGGSFIMGGLHTEESRCERYALDVGCVVVALDYRLAPEHPFPAALEDCALVLKWMMGNAGQLDIDRGRVAVGGLSAGGALATGLAARVRDEHGPELALQLLLFPVLDARADSPSAVGFVDTPILTAGDVAAMWRMYLGTGWKCSDRPPSYASPMHLDDVAGLPPVYLCTAQFDPLRDEALRYAERLLAAGVTVDLRLYARAFHAFDSFEAAKLAQTARQEQADALRSAFN